MSGFKFPPSTALDSVQSPQIYTSCFAFVVLCYTQKSRVMSTINFLIDNNKFPTLVNKIYLNELNLIKGNTKHLFEIATTKIYSKGDH